MNGLEKNASADEGNLPAQSSSKERARARMAEHFANEDRKTTKTSQESALDKKQRLAAEKRLAERNASQEASRLEQAARKKHKSDAEAERLRKLAEPKVVVRFLVPLTFAETEHAEGDCYPLPLCVARQWSAAGFVAYVGEDSASRAQNGEVNMKMKIRLLVAWAGTFDGFERSYAPGDELEVPEDVAHAQVAAGRAEYLSREDAERAPNAAKIKNLLRVKNLVSWAGDGDNGTHFSYAPGQIVALDERVAHARVAAGLCAYLSAEDALRAEQPTQPLPVGSTSGRK